MSVISIAYELLFWAIGFFLLWRIPRCAPATELSDQGDRRNCGFSIIIPARNEERTLPYLLESLKIQTLSPQEIILVNDGSSDATEEVAKSYGVRIIPAPTKPKGWSGKSWACWKGARAASGRVLLFLDADVRLAPTAIARLWSTYERDGGLVSVQPYHVVEKVYEQLSAFFNIVVMMGPNCFSLLGRRLRPTGAFGPCVMCDRRTYLEVEAHKAVKAKVVEDIPMGKLFRAAGVQTACYGGRGYVSFRMYPSGLRQLIEGWTKSMVFGAGEIHPVFLLLIVLWLCGCTAAVRGLIAGLAGSGLHNWNYPRISGIALYLLYTFQVGWMLKRVGRFSLVTAVLYTIPLLAFHLVFIRSFVQSAVLRRVRWRGRNIRIE
jgi:4,4'-diaponeurosporenoate glycosyltransferase